MRVLFTATIRPGGKKGGRGDFPGINTQVPKMKTDLHGRKIASVAKLGAPRKQKPGLILHR